MQTNTRSDMVNTIAAHPDFIRWVEEWKTLNDVVDGGASTVKLMAGRYLPPTSGQLIQWNKAMPGLHVEDLGNGQYVCGGNSTGCVGQGAYAYKLYQARAVFYDYPAETCRQVVGRLTGNKAEIDLGTELNAMEDNATADGIGMQSVLEVIFNEQCKYSRCGVLADFAKGESTEGPFLCVYGALRVKNWSVKRNPISGKDELQFVILDESKYVQTGLNWDYRHLIRVCALDDNGDYFTQIHDISEFVDGGNIPDEIAINFLEPDPKLALYPTFKGQMSKKIPFVFINATNISETPELPILSTVADKSLAIYRGEADYRQALFMQGQATPAFSGATIEEASEFLLGASGAVASNDDKFKAWFMEVSGDGLSEMRESQNNLHELVVAEGSKLLNAGANESGDALKERTDSQTVSLNVIASSCEMGLLKLFEIIKEWGSISSDTVIVLNREFTSGTATPDGLVKMMQAWQLGAPITKQDIHEWAREGGLSETAWEEVQNELDMSGRGVAE